MKYIVKQGDNLSDIGKQYGVDYSGITGYKSGDPNLIYPGEELDVPETNPVALPPITEIPEVTDSVKNLVIPPTEQTNIPMVAPKKIVEGKLLNNYGERSAFWSNSGGIHYGTDFVAPEGTITNAPEGEWEVVKAGDKEDYSVGYGNSVVIKNLTDGTTLRYSHLNTPVVVKGERIKGGTPIGLIGSTGHSTEPHLDIEYRDSKGNINDIMKSEYSKYF